MLNGRCPRCNSRNVFKKLNGVVTSSGDKIYIYGISSFGAKKTNRMTLVCTTCGFYENFITDKSVLSKIAEKWDKV